MDVVGGDGLMMMKSGVPMMTMMTTIKQQQQQQQQSEGGVFSVKPEPENQLLQQLIIKSDGVKPEPEVCCSMPTRCLVGFFGLLSMLHVYDVDAHPCDT
jgi:hypothetical protein